MKASDVAIIIQNLVQFYSIKAGIDALINKGYIVDIYVPVFNDSTGMDDMFNATYSSLISLGYSPMRLLDNLKKYRILLEPYPIKTYEFKYKYRIKYEYAPIAAKPNLTYIPEENIYYDAILCTGDYEAEYLKAYSNTYVIGSLKYINFHKKLNIKNNKSILLYLPTYGNLSSIDNIINTINSLKQDYYIIAKFHHGTSFLKAEIDRINQLINVCDEFYDHTTQLSELLEKTKVVLTDNSGSIFESIYVQVPVAIYSDDTNKNKIGNFNTIQHMAVKSGFIPYTNNLSDIPEILKAAISEKYINKENELKKILFNDIKNPVDNFINVIEKYLSDNVNTNYKSIHDLLASNYKNNLELINKLNFSLNQERDITSKKEIEIKNLKNNINILENQISSKNKIIDYYRDGKLYKFANWLYKIYHTLIGKRNNYK